MNEQIDVVWQHARWAVEEANNRYALDVYVRVFSDAYNVTLCLASTYGRHEMVFAHKQIQALGYSEVRASFARGQLAHVLRHHASLRSTKSKKETIL